MSAFVVSNKSIACVLRAMDQKWEKCGNLLPAGRHKTKEDILNSFGNELLKMNIDSVNYRYDDSIKARKVNFKKMLDGDGNSFKALACAVKQIRCWEYQSCELDYYDGYWQWVVMDKLHNVLLDRCMEEMGEVFVGDKGDAQSYERKFDKLSRTDEYDRAMWG